LRLRGQPSFPGENLILVLVDADKDCPKEWGPKLLEWAAERHPRPEVACILAKAEYETWFVAAAKSLVDSGHLELKSGEAIPDDPEHLNLKKKWIEDRFVKKGARPGEGARYSPTQDQPVLTRDMDLWMCYERSRSSRKLHGELRKRLS